MFHIIIAYLQQNGHEAVSPGLYHYQWLAGRRGLDGGVLGIGFGRSSNTVTMLMPFATAPWLSGSVTSAVTTFPDVIVFSPSSYKKNRHN